MLTFPFAGRPPPSCLFFFSTGFPSLYLSSMRFPWILLCVRVRVCEYVRVCVRVLLNARPCTFQHVWCVCVCACVCGERLWKEFHGMIGFPCQAFDKLSYILRNSLTCGRQHRKSFPPHAFPLLSSWYTSVLNSFHKCHIHVRVSLF